MSAFILKKSIFFLFLPFLEHFSDCRTRPIRLPSHSMELFVQEYIAPGPHLVLNDISGNEITVIQSISHKLYFKNCFISSRLAQLLTNVYIGY